MPIYKGTTELTKIADFLTATEHDITEVYFGDQQVFTVWNEYDGTLPATYSANGSTIADYRVYGSAGGVGDRTVNLFDVNVEQGGWTGQNGMTPTKYGTDNPSFYYTRCRGDSIYAIDPEKQYTISFFPKTLQASVKLLNLVGKQIADTGWGNDHTVTGAYGICFSIRNSTNSKIIPNDIQGITITEGSTAPAEYIPYGYEVPMSVSDGTASTTTPIYIGDTPLGEDEYVDYGEQKIYRMSGGVLTPTDPPVPLPALPTVDGINIVDYAGQSAAVPSRFVAKYRKEGY